MFLLLAVLWALAGEPFLVRRHDLTLEIPGLPEALDGYRILHVSDLEATSPGTRERQVGSLARQTPPDLIVITGDLVDKSLPRARRLAAYRQMAAWLASLGARDGVLFVQGHGERHAAMGERELEDALATSGVRVLWDDMEIIERGGGALSVAGVRVRDYAGEGRWIAGEDGSVRLGATGRSSYLELAGLPADALELSGRMRFTSPRDAIGVLMHSRLGQGEERLYVVQRHRDSPSWTASARGTVYTGGVRREITPSPGAWHHFRVRSDAGPRSVRVRARLWEAGQHEPEGWHLDFTDDHDTRITGGRPGLYAKGPGVKEFADLRWEPAGPVWWREPRGADHLAALLRRAPAAAPVILLSHTPDVFPDAAALSVPVVLAGHTQGGQVRLPLFGALATSTHLGRRFAAGLFRQDATVLFINRGLGTTRVPVRFLAPPEAAFLTLRRPA
jgi:predicted MPP superfamily phosphohydrolase